MIEVFREVRRVLRKDGTCWINLGDSYWNGGGEKRDGGHGFVDGGKPKLDAAKGALLQAKSTTGLGLKPKDLCGIPWRVAFALQADGWWLRSAITLAKKNPMPESTTDRPTKASEFMFLLTKSKDYYYDNVGANEGCRYVNEPHLSNLQAIEIAKSILLKEGRASGDLQRLFQGSRSGVSKESKGNNKATDLESPSSENGKGQSLCSDASEHATRKSDVISPPTTMGENAEGQSGYGAEAFQSECIPEDSKQSHGRGVGRNPDQSSQQNVSIAGRSNCLRWIT
jgi:hypothetical protein